jgi:hypothetical protein
MVLYSLLEEAGCAGLVPDMKTLLESDTSNRVLGGDLGTFTEELQELHS